MIKLHKRRIDEFKKEIASQRALLGGKAEKEKDEEGEEGEEVVKESDIMGPSSPENTFLSFLKEKVSSLFSAPLLSTPVSLISQSLELERFTIVNLIANLLWQEPVLITKSAFCAGLHQSLLDIVVATNQELPSREMVEEERGKMKGRGERKRERKGKERESKTKRKEGKDL